MKQLSENKELRPSENKKMVTVKIAPGREVSGVGKAGDVVRIDEEIALDLITKGLAIFVKE